MFNYRRAFRSFCPNGCCGFCKPPTVQLQLDIKAHMKGSVPDDKGTPYGFVHIYPGKKNFLAYTVRDCSRFTTLSLTQRELQFVISFFEFNRRFPLVTIVSGFQRSRTLSLKTFHIQTLRSTIMSYYLNTNFDYVSFFFSTRCSYIG